MKKRMFAYACCLSFVVQASLAISIFGWYAVADMAFRVLCSAVAIAFLVGGHFIRC